MGTEDTKEIGARLQRWRRALGLSVREVARQAGLDDKTVSAIEHGRVANPTILTVQALADVFGLSVSQLLAGRQPTITATQLPTLAPYLRTKYPHLSGHAVTEMGRYFDYLQARYGEHRPARGDDER